MSRHFLAGFVLGAVLLSAGCSSCRSACGHPLFSKNRRCDPCCPPAAAVAPGVPPAGAVVAPAPGPTADVVVPGPPPPARP
jgi:hypothetical protein